MASRTRGRVLALLTVVLVLALVAAACGDDGSVFGQGNDTSTTAADGGTAIPDETTTQAQQQTTTTQAQQQTTTTQAQQQTTATAVPPPTTATTTTTLPTATLLPSATAYYSEFNLTSGFFDPWEYTDQDVRAGSLDPVDVGYLPPSNCYGWANDIPDFEVTYTAGSYDLLRFYFIADDSSEDAILVINDPSGQWHCNDDSFGTLNPSVDFAFPSSGVYDIWIGTVHEAELIDGSFFITELSGNHP